MIKNICVISTNYPHPKFPEHGAFVEKLVKNWVNSDIEVNVINPYSIPDAVRGLGKKKIRNEFAGNTILRPYYLTLTNNKIGILDFKQFGRNQSNNAVNRVLDKITTPDVYYGKFLLSGGFAAYNAAKKKKAKVVIDIGESVLLDSLNKEELKIAKTIVSGADGFACVSKRLENEILSLGAAREKVLYAPNTVETSRFFPMDKSFCRTNLGLPKNDFIVVFVGHFKKRKGALRVLKALNSLNLPIKGVFLGHGANKPSGKNVLFTGSVENEKVPIWLNAGDLFVLPTLAEGYCNAINEAMACGLPIISSDIPDIKHQVSQGNGLLVNPLDIEQIAKAIYTLYNDRSLLNKMGQESLRITGKRSKETRESQILNWMNEVIFGDKD